MDNKFGWAFIGCGDIAHTVANELVNSDCRIVAAWNRTNSKAEDFANKYSCKAYKTFEEAINAPEVEGVYIALTADIHYEYIKKCIKNHKAVLCEKPFVVNAKEAEEIYALAKKESVYVSEAMWTWHNTTAQTVKRWLEENRIRKIKEVKVKYGYPLMRYKRFERLKDPKRLGGAIMDIGVYGLRYCVELFGYPNKVECDGRLDGGVDCGEKVLLHYNDFTVHLDIALDKFLGESFKIYGENGKIIVPLFHMAKSAKVTGKNKERIKVDDLLYKTQFSNVASEIRAGYKESIIIKPENDINCMRLMDECRRQMNLVFPCEVK